MRIVCRLWLLICAWKIDTVAVKQYMSLRVCELSCRWSDRLSTFTTKMKIEKKMMEANGTIYLVQPGTVRWYRTVVTWYMYFLYGTVLVPGYTHLTLLLDTTVKVLQKSVFLRPGPTVSIMSPVKKRLTNTTQRKKSVKKSALDFQLKLEVEVFIRNRKTLKT